MRNESGLATDECTVLSMGTNNDVIVTYVKRLREDMMRVMNICNERDVQTGE